MAEEHDILTQLESKFPFLQGKVRTTRARRLFAEVPADKFKEVFAHAIGNMEFRILCTMTGLDLGEQLGVIYHLAKPNGIMLNVQTSVPKAKPVLATVSDVFPAADAYERELVDLLGFEVTGLVEGPRYPLPDGWPQGQFPLRKDWKAEMLKEAKP